MPTVTLFSTSRGCWSSSRRNVVVNAFTLGRSDLKPDKWIAAALGLFLQPVGLLYVARPGWAAFYFALLLGVSAYTIVFPSVQENFLPQTLLAFGVAIVAAFHAFFAARHTDDAAPRPRYSQWRWLLAIVAAFVFLTVAMRAFVFEAYRVPSRSMEPTMPLGTLILVEKWGYGHYSAYGVDILRKPIVADIARADVVVFDYPIDPTRSYVKRVVGLPGDEVSYRAKRLSINGSAVFTIAVGNAGSHMESMGAKSHTVQIDDAAAPINLRHVQNFAGRDQCTIDATGFACKVPAGHYFVLGDNRDNSDDSRYWGFVPASAIVGKVVHASPPRG
jgi:signal peptidase I